MPIPDQEARPARLFASSNALQGIGDQLVSGKTVLPWLFAQLGVPHFFTALLVPIRESGSMLPQAALTPWVTSRPTRKKLWVWGSVVQGISALVIAGAAAVFEGWVLGTITITALAVLSVFRALCSLTGKDVQGRTISKGSRGEVTGLAAQASGAVTLLVGLVLAFLGQLPPLGLAAVLGGGALSWFVAAAIFSSIDEPVPDEAETAAAKKNASEGPHWWSDTWKLYTSDEDFRRFVNVRALLLVTALSTTFIVTLSHQSGTTVLSGLAGFVLASGLANLVGGKISGIWSDRSSRLVMSWASVAASLTLMLVVACAHWAPTWVCAWALPLGFFLVNLAHTGIRVARKTYIVDMAGGDKRTFYVGAANTMMGAILLVVGAISAVISLAGPTAALLFLAALGFIGAWRARMLREVSA